MQNRAKLATPPVNIGEERIEGRSLGKGQMNPVRHRLSVGRNLPHLYYVGKHDNSGYRYLMEYNRLATKAAIPWSLKTLNHPVLDLSGARSRAWWNMQPRFVGEVDMLNFLFELKDFRDIARTLMLRSDDLMRIRKALWRLTILPRSKRAHLWDSSGAAASAILVNNFALEPLFSDFGKIAMQTMVIVREAQRKFELAGEKWQKSHFSEEIWRENSTTVGTGNYYWLSNGILKTSKFTATLRYMYDYRLRSDWKAFVDYWGLSFSFNRFWNAIPFSFLCDYFIQIGNSIKAMETDPNVNILDTQYCESLLTTFRNGSSIRPDQRAKLYVVNGTYGLQQDFADLCISGYVGWLYERYPAEPLKAPASPVFKQPKGKQALNMLALARCFL